MAKTKLLGNDRKEKLEQQKKAAKKANKKKRKSPARFFRDIISELKKVTWPTAKDLAKYTGAVIAFILIMAVIVGLMDAGLNSLFELVLKQ
ncbi:MAG: preprotein translocase subunit SecE [Eubacteriales bacterium]|nr:preprotein translocase subunit SecE [Eubacteriales bacterium]